MNFGTRLRTALAILTAVNAGLVAFDVSVLDSELATYIYKVASVALNAIIIGVVAYFNNDFNEISAKHTGNMRQEKAELKQDYVGEKFYDEQEISEITEGGDTDE